MTSLVFLAVLISACTPAETSPELPRPTHLTTTTTTLTVTTSAVVETTDPTARCPTVFCLVYHIDRDAGWSDGTAVTAGDFATNIETSLDPLFGGPLPGYDLISGHEVIDEKTIRIELSRPFGSWQRLFDRLLPAGATELRDIANIPTTGPFRFVEWVEGDRIVLQRDPSWWSRLDPLSGETAGDIAEIRFVFIEDVGEMVEALEDGEVDVVTARPDQDTLELLSDVEDIEFVIMPGPFWEHIDFHHDDPLLSQRWFREVVSLAIDREKILDRTVRLEHPEAQPLDNTQWMTTSNWYQPHFTDRYDPETAEQMLIDRQCARGDDNVYVCQGTRLSFVWATTNDDPARREIFESVAEDLTGVGIELVGAFRPPSDLLSPQTLFASSDVWQVINFSWRARTDPLDAADTYVCDGALNVNRYCSDEVDTLIEKAGSIPDAAARAAVLNQADERYLGDIAIIPLYQKPTMMAWAAEIEGLSPNTTSSTDLWNVAAWKGKSSVVIALPSEPTHLDPHLSDDPNANIVLAALLYGAFGMTPNQVSTPVLVDVVDIVEGDH